MRIVSLVRLSADRMYAEDDNSPNSRQECSLYPVKLGKQLQSSHQLEFDCFSMAPRKQADLLCTCFEYGADNVYLLNDPCFAGSDTYASSLILATAIQAYAGSAQLIVCSMQSAQGETGHMASALAVRLQLPAVIGVVEICELDEKHMICIQNHEYYQEKVCIHLPAVISLHRDFIFNEQLCGITLFDRRKAKKKTIRQLNHNDIGLPAEVCGIQGSKTKMVAGKNMPINKNHETYAGSTLEQCRKLLSLMEI
ncbi:Acryloyl-CoA reductase electron transfer subunit gamma [compost metagenome]